MKAIRIHGPQQVRLDEIVYPGCGDDEALVEVMACGVCGSDIAYIDAGNSSFMQKSDGPSALGHEAAGKVVALGKDVKDLQVGDRVAVNPMDNVLRNAIGNGLAEGAFAQVVKVRNMAQGGRLLKLPPNLPYDIAALTEPMGVALHAVNRSNVNPESKVAVFGAGPIGLGAVIWLKHKGVRNVVAIDLCADRLERARQFGADGVVEAGVDNVAERLKALHGVNGDGAPDTDIFLDAAGSQAALTDVVQCAKFGAALTVVAIHKKPVTLDLCAMVIKEIKLVTAMGYPAELPEVVEFLGNNAERMRGFISDHFGIEEFSRAVARAREPSSSKVMVRIGA